jgi:hypothetical protein
MEKARSEIAAWIKDSAKDRPRAGLDHEAPAAFIADAHRQWPAPFPPKGSAGQAIADTTLARKKISTALPIVFSKISCDFTNLIGPYG